MDEPTKANVRRKRSAEGNVSKALGVIEKALCMVAPEARTKLLDTAHALFVQ